LYFHILSFFKKKSFHRHLHHIKVTCKIVKHYIQNHLINDDSWKTLKPLAVNQVVSYY
jgi:hypothetical protein